MRQVKRLALENIIKILKKIRYFKENRNHNLFLLHQENLNFNLEFRQANFYYKN